MRLAAFGKTYGDRRLFEGVDLSLREHRITFIMGANGAGKTTLLKCICGLEGYEGNIYPEEGGGESSEGILPGTPSGGDSGGQREFAAACGNRCLVIWDDCPFYRSLSGLKNLRLLSGPGGVPEDLEETAERYLPREVLRQKTGQYSYGQRKKLALALAEITDPEYLIMDEISNGLDYETMLDLKKRLRGWSERKTILLTGHQFGFYNDLVDDVFLIRDRKLILVEEEFRNSEKTLEEIYDKEISHA